MPVPADIIDAIDALEEQRDTTSAARTERDKLQEQLLAVQDQLKNAEDKYREEYVKQNDLAVKLQARIADEYLIPIPPPSTVRPNQALTRVK